MRRLDLRRDNLAALPGAFAPGREPSLSQRRNRKPLGHPSASDFVRSKDGVSF